MPMFEFTCDSCSREFEELLRSAEDERTLRCPHCGKAKATRKFSSFASPASARPAALPVGGGCGRCGDPNGPCGMG
ncbi:MAG: hypothetical protein IT449_17265 [Phycisphaerales bacterium]|nr:hypothetical protein [Phycisphaerales bacterium]